LDYVKDVRFNDKDYYQELKMANTICPPDKLHLLPLSVIWGYVKLAPKL